MAAKKLFRDSFLSVCVRELGFESLCSLQTQSLTSSNHNQNWYELVAFNKIILYKGSCLS